MNIHKDCVEVTPKDFRVMLKKIKKDGGTVINIKNGFYDRFSPNLLIGYLEGSRAYIKGDKK